MVRLQLSSLLLCQCSVHFRIYRLFPADVISTISNSVCSLYGLSDPGLPVYMWKAPSSWLVLWQLSIKIHLNGLRQVCSNEYKYVSSMQNQLALRQPAFTVVILTVCVRYAQVDSFTLAISHKLHFVNQPLDSIFPSVSVLLWGFQMLPLSPGAV